MAKYKYNNRIGANMKKWLTLFMLMLLLIILLSNFAGEAFSCNKQDFDKAVLANSGKQVIYIGPDGSIDPEAAPIQHNGNTYTITDDIYAPIVVDKSNIIIDGAGYTLFGPYNGTRTDLPIFEQNQQTNQTSNATLAHWSVGIDLAKETIQDLTIENLNIKNFSIGIWIWTSNNTFIGNAITENIIGILLSAPNNNITGNYVSDNEHGIFFGANEPGNLPTFVTLSRNCFVDNLRQLSGCVCAEYNETEDLHTWDDGKVGNYWSDYDGTDINGDGIGDT
ncbi:MAG: nitrous oxide reductase family maturation protein NosD, partial [Ignavibacteria bacterium]